MKMEELKSYLLKRYKEAKDNFSPDEMAYSLLFGLAPTAWDIATDIKLGFNLEADGDVQESVMCFPIIANPGFVFVGRKF